MKIALVSSSTTLRLTNPVRWSCYATLWSGPQEHRHQLLFRKYDDANEEVDPYSNPKLHSITRLYDTLAELASDSRSHHRFYRTGYNATSCTRYDSRPFSTQSSPTTMEDTPVENRKLIPFLLADIGEGIKEVEIIQWFVQPGQTVQQFDLICQVQSDKATVDITSRYDGVIAALGGTSATDDDDDASSPVIIQVGQPLLYLYPNDDTNTDTDVKSTPIKIQTATLASDRTNGNHGESDRVIHTSSTVIDIPTEHRPDSRKSIINFAMEERSDDSSTIPTSTGGSSNSIAQASPAVRRIAREYGISHEVFSTMIPGTGPNQRILKSDVLSYVKNSSTNHGMRHGNAPFDGKKVEGATRKESTNVDTKDKIVTLRGYTRHMISTMTTSLQIPHMCFGDEIIMNNIMTIRQQINDSLFAAPPGSDKNSEEETTAGIQKTKISVLALLIKAVSCAMMDYPIINSIQMMDNDTSQSVTNGTILQKHDHNFGIAIDTMSRGLVVPVLHQCQNKSILTIQKDIDHLKQLAYTNQLQMEHFADLTFTISNIGSIGSGMFLQPVIVPPTLAMGAFGYTKTVPRFRSTCPVQTGSVTSSSSSSSTTTVREIYEAQVMNVTWAGDHRFLDGATIGRFHNRFRYYVEEQPMMLLLK